MSGRINLGVGIGTFAVMLIMSFSVLYFTNQGKEQSEQNYADIQILKQENTQLKKIVSDFIDRWDKRVETSNKVNNGTQSLVLNGVNEILNTVRQEFGNLTEHRIVTNATFDRVNESLNKIERILNTTTALTGPEYDKLADQKVKDIVGNVTELIRNEPKRPQVK